MKPSDLFIPVIITGILVFGVVKKVDIMAEFATGAKANLKVALEILPSLILLMTAVGMFTQSGGIEMFAAVAKPVTDFLGFPQECLSLAIIRPVSGSGALCTLETILTGISPDSYAGRVASVLMGSTETTFYTITVYFSAIKQKAYPAAVVSACFADLCGFVLSALMVRIFFPV